MYPMRPRTRESPSKPQLPPFRTRRLEVSGFPFQPASFPCFLVLLWIQLTAVRDEAMRLRLSSHGTLPLKLEEYGKALLGTHNTKHDVVVIHPLTLNTTNNCFFAYPCLYLPYSNLLVIFRVSKPGGNRKPEQVCLLLTLIVGASFVLPMRSTLHSKITTPPGTNCRTI